jgi:hypothetical protein
MAGSADDELEPSPVGIAPGGAPTVDAHVATGAP